MKHPRVVIVGMLGVALALLVAILYGTLLGYRRDYLGHYAAGYGGSLIAIALTMGIIPERTFATACPLVIELTCLGCIALGAVAESTVFRIAKFDEVDFCNQSLGAALAGLGCLAMCRGAKPDTAVLRGGYVIGTGFLIAGFYFAFS